MHSDHEYSIAPPSSQEPNSESGHDQREPTTSASPPANAAPQLESQPISAPGWDALDRGFTAVYPGQVPHQFSSASAYDLARSHPLPAISVWERSQDLVPGERRTQASWHYVSYGLTELFDKTSPNRDISGFGFEITLTIPRQANEERPPEWPISLIQGLGHHVLSQGKGFNTGHCVDLGGSLVPASQARGHCGLSGIVFVPDPVVPQLQSLHGHIVMLRAVGVWPDELAVFRDLDTRQTTELMAEINPSAFTAPYRSSLVADAHVGKVFHRHQVGLEL